MDYLNLLAQLLPPGIALSAEQEHVAGLLGKTAAELDTVDDLDAALLRETDPRNALMLLEEIETSLGLPDRCSANSTTLQERQNNAYEKLISPRGARRTRYLSILARLQQPDADIERFSLHTCENHCEDAVFGNTEWLFTFAVTLKQNTASTPSTCESHCEEPLAVWGNRQIECVLNKEKPAYSHLFIKYAGTS